MESVHLPDPVRRSIEEYAEVVGFAALKRAAAAMSDAYREGRPMRLVSPDLVAAYLVTRMPATYAATYSVLKEVHERLPHPVNAILDIGAGTGAASLAAHACFPSASLTMLERDSGLSQAARIWLPSAQILTADAVAASLPVADLVIASYSVGEFRQAIAQRLWESARVALVIIEPGTSAGFARIRDLRAQLLQAGARMVAPCPAETACPIVDPDWCHFAARVERSSLHRRLKDAGLGYEDEKFSYVAFAREPVPLTQARVVRRPLHRPGLITIETCTPAGLRTDRVTKRDRDRFRRARHLSWGEGIEDSWTAEPA
jgi:ribosomal protein RSM22 (predicted rRNA methylase)